MTDTKKTEEGQEVPKFMLNNDDIRHIVRTFGIDAPLDQSVKVNKQFHKQFHEHMINFALRKFWKWSQQYCLEHRGKGQIERRCNCFQCRAEVMKYFKNQGVW